MPGCCAVGCSNRTEKGFKLYSIPNGKSTQEKERRRIWLARIKRPTFRPSKHTVLCETHFTPDQFEKNIPQKLKPTAVPSIFAHRVYKDKKRKPPKQCSNENDAIKKPSDVDHSYAADRRTAVSEGVAQEHSNNTMDVNEHETACTSTSECIMQQCPVIPENEEDPMTQLRCVQRKLAEEQKANKALRTKFSRLFNSDQMTFLEQETDPYVVWTDATIEKALQLRISCGFSGYDTLLSHGFPLPSHRTLRRKLQHLPFKKGVVEMLAMKSTLSA